MHLLTASGILFALLALLEVASVSPDPRWVFLWLAIATLVDAADGPLARRIDVTRHAPVIQGRAIDDIVDYITFTFVPLILVLRMGWIAGPHWFALASIGLAMITSLLGFAHRMAKDEREGFFRGFPSYWNLMAYYFGLLVAYYGATGRVVVAVSTVGLSVLTVMPVRFIYPNMAPRSWRMPILVGAALWALLLLVTLPWYPRPSDPSGAVPEALMWVSLAYPMLYVLASLHLDRQARRRART